MGFPTCRCSWRAAHRDNQVCRLLSAPKIGSTSSASMVSSMPCVNLLCEQQHQQQHRLRSNDWQHFTGAAEGHADAAAGFSTLQSEQSASGHDCEKKEASGDAATAADQCSDAAPSSQTTLLRRNMLILAAEFGRSVLEHAQRTHALARDVLSLQRVCERNQRRLGACACIRRSSTSRWQKIECYVVCLLLWELCSIYGSAVRGATAVIRRGAL